MKTNDTHQAVARIARRSVMLAGLLTIALALAASSFAQSSGAAAPRLADTMAALPAQGTANPPAAPRAKAPRGTGEGIQVYGRWTIEVRNRDGSVVKHVELENALLSTGPAALAGLLSGNLVSGGWYLTIDGNPSPCSSSQTCVIFEAGSGLAAPYGCTTTLGPVSSGTQPYCYDTLVPSLTNSSLILSGQAYVDTSTSITAVSSVIDTCGVAPSQSGSDNMVSPSVCFSGESALATGFTQYQFGAAGSCGGSGQALCQIPVQAGQTISASVQFSFSSPSSPSADAAVARPHTFLRVPNPVNPVVQTPVTH